MFHKQFPLSYWSSPLQLINISILGNRLPTHPAPAVDGHLWVYQNCYLILNVPCCTVIKLIFMCAALINPFTEINELEKCLLLNIFKLNFSLCCIFSLRHRQFLGLTPVKCCLCENILSSTASDNCHMMWTYDIFCHVFEEKFYCIIYYFT